MLPHLGPLARALSIALEHAEGKRYDRIIPGYLLHDPDNGKIDKLGFFCSSFLSFRGATLKAEVLKKYS